MSLPFHPQRKGPTRKTLKGRKQRAKYAHVRTVRKQVFEDHDDRCVLCQWRAESMHEVIPTGVIGSRVIATTRTNSVPVCGSGTTKCHGLLQQHIVRVVDIKGKTRYVVDIERLSHPEVQALMTRLEQRRLATLAFCT